MKYSSLLACLFISLNLSAQEYNVNSIPPELLEGADAVVRKDQAQFEILSIDKAEFSKHYAVTIFNDRANNLASLVMGYDKLSNLTDIEANIYDANGKRVYRVKANDINDRSAYTGNLFDDSRIKYVNLEQSNYPYTVEYRYKKKYKFLYFIPSWFFIGRENLSVMSSEYILKYPEHIGARYKEYNFDGTKEEKEEGGTKTISWKMTNLFPIEFEQYGPSYREVLPSLEFGVSKFSYEGYQGDMSTWDGLAKWQSSLNSGRDVLPQATIDKIQSLTAGLPRTEQIRKIYEFVQENTRYVSIQEGVGGLQPFPANVVDEVGYGDCKALSNYTKSLLKAVGIDAFYTKIYAGNDPSPVDPNFPGQFSNHVIIAVPNELDTIWLECTSQTNPFGYLGTFTGDREALLINEEGGHLVRTTTYTTNSNKMLLEATVKVDKDGNATIQSDTKYQGIMASDMLRRTLPSDEDKKKYLEKSIDIPTFEIDDFSIEREGADVNQSVNLWVNKLLSKSGTRLFLQPNVMNKNYFVPLKYKDRKTDVVVRHGFHEYDTVNFEFPAGLRIEAAFDPIIIESDFGAYHAEIIATEDGKFQYVRHFMQRKGRFDAASYDEYLNFHKKVVRADKRKIALISGT